MTWNLASRLGSAAVTVAAVSVALIVIGFGTGAELLMTIGIVAGLAAAAWSILQVVRRGRHREALATFAVSYGWEFEPRTTSYSGRFSGPPFESGLRRRQEDVLRGSFSGATCATYTHVYEIDGNRTSASGATLGWAAFGDARLGSAMLSSGTRGSRVEEFQVTLVELPVDLPRIDLVPEGIGARTLKLFGGSDVDVESYEFNRRWRVVAHDARYAHSLLDPRMIDRLTQPDVEGVALRIDGGALLMWSPGRRGTDDLARRLSLLTSVARRIPAHVVREHLEAGLGRGDDRPIPPTAPDWATTPGALTSGRWTGIEPGPPATGEGWRGLPSGDEDFDIFRIGWRR
ncbi:hypothetical protein [Demequina capsici]|uniref:DUF3137 domain-containing protein n=1 Tax=Demequina capsici TaxID=3075620 RepID=A0AA96F8F2_9MICO|nr:hypothetical protein [Demequina sp. OYTSA14]WNM24677.1 hypothetical protein RN606_00585 [Demequina sp. OYTSA14]